MSPLKKWWSEAELNCRHEDFQSSALPTELSDHVNVGKWIATPVPFATLGMARNDGN